MTVPVRLASRFARALVPLLVVPALHAATPCRAEPPATLGSPAHQGRGRIRSDLDLFPADPLSTIARRWPTRTAAWVHRAPWRRAHRLGAAHRSDLGPEPVDDSSRCSASSTTFWDTDRSGLRVLPGTRRGLGGVAISARAEIEAGVSRGRFAAIMNHLALALRESHTDRLGSGRELLGAQSRRAAVRRGRLGRQRHFGAGLTPLPDDSLLVYKTVPNHPLGLVPGDIVLGYDGVPWKQLYPELLAAQLPLTGWWWGSSESSWTHSMLMSAGLNWHLFDTIDVVKHATGRDRPPVRRPAGQHSPSSLDCTEQLPIPGVPMPDYLGSDDPVSWGIVRAPRSATSTCAPGPADAGIQFYAAVDSLLTQYQTTGLIFDFRTNYGGNMFLSYPALSLLFGGDDVHHRVRERCNGTDHLAMCPSPNGPPSAYVIHGTAAADYDRPIAVLVGPGALSSGDQVANLFSFHPQARFFGKSTSTAFNAPVRCALPISGWSSRYAVFDAYRVTDPTNYLTHDEFPVDEPVWLTPDDVARGKDTVVEAALHWILNEPPVCDAVHATIDGPPDHELATVTIEGVSDPDGDPLTIIATAITQDEPVNGRGDGNTCPDATLLNGVARVRRERAGNGNGRVYVVSFTASDGHGGECQGTVPVCVPHDRGRNRTNCQDDGQLYDALAACN